MNKIVFFMTSKFRINCKNLFLTYPQCTLTKEELMVNLKLIKHEWSYAIICDEKHADGTPHLHAFLRFKKKVDIRKETYFDFSGFHPNIQAAKNSNASINYIKKDGSFIEFGEFDNPDTPMGLIPAYNEVTYTILCYHLEPISIGMDGTML